MVDVIAGKSYEELKLELRETEKKRLEFERALKDLDHNFAEESRKRQRRETVSAEREPDRKRFGKPDEDDKPKVQSTVVSLAPIDSSKSENETDNKNEQTTSKESGGGRERVRGLGDKTRNRNLFGKLLFGTLNKFQEESGKTTEQAARRHEIESKIEDKVAAERKEMLERNTKGLEECTEKVRLLKEALHKLSEERAMNNLQATWDKHAALLTNFIKTNTEPAVYYLPFKHNEKTKALVPEKPVVEEEPVVIDRKKDRDETSDDEGSPPPEERNGGSEDNKEKVSDEKEKEPSGDKPKDEDESEKKEKDDDNGDGTKST